MVTGTLFSWLHRPSTRLVKKCQGESGLGLGSLPGLVAAVAQQWAKRRADGRDGDASAATQNQRLAILSSFYRYANRMIDAGDVPNPIVKVKRQKVQAYRGAHALEVGEVREKLAAVDRSTPSGLREYALLTLALRPADVPPSSGCSRGAT